MAEEAKIASQMQRIRFIVHGKVQKVYFRAYTENKAKELGLVGWVMNKSDKTVEGCAEGPRPKVESLLTWLEKEGSPKSQVTKVDSTIKDITSYSYKEFSRYKDDTKVD